MEDMYVHQYAKVEPNRLRDGAAIGANARTRSPPTQTLFYTLYALVYLSIYISKLYIWGKRKFNSLQTYP